MSFDKREILTGFQIDKVLRYGNLTVKIALILVIACLTMSTLLLIVYGGINEDTYNTWYSIVIWYSVLGSMWIFICSPIYLLLVAIYTRYSSETKLNSNKGQLILLVIAILTAATFIVTVMLIKK